MQRFHLPCRFLLVEQDLGEGAGLGFGVSRLEEEPWKLSSSSRQLPHVKHNRAGVDASVFCLRKAARMGWVAAHRCLPAGWWHAGTWGEWGLGHPQHCSNLRDALGPPAPPPGLFPSLQNSLQRRYVPLLGKMRSP